MTKLKKWIGDKKFYKMTFAIILPIMIQQLLLSVAGYIDSLMINGYGGASTAAYDGVSAANRLVFVLNFVWLGVAATASIFIAQYFGAKNEKKVKESLQLSLIVSIIIGIISFFIIQFGGHAVVNAYIQGEERRQFGYDYLNYFKWGSVITAINLAFANAFRSIKRPKVALYASISGIVVNIFLNYCLIFGKLGFPEMAAGGAALATVISRVIETIVFIIVILVSKDIYFNKKLFSKWYFSKNLIKEYIKKGIPVVLNEVLWSLGITLFALFYTYHNDFWYNAYAISQNITDLFFIIFSGLGSGSAVIIGASLGRSDFKQAKEDGNKLMGLAVMLGIVMGILMVITGPFIISMFKTSKETRNLIMGILIVTAIFLAIYSYNSVCFFILRAGGDSLRAFLLDQLPTYLIGLPIAIIFGLNAKNWGISMVFIFSLSHLSDLSKVFLATHFVRKEQWLVNITLNQNRDKKEMDEGKI